MVFINLLWTIESEAKGSSNAVILEDTTERVDLYPHMDMMKDREREITINDVISSEYQEKFVPSEKIVQKPGFFETGNWLRFEINNRSNERDWLLELAFPLVYEIEVFMETEDGIELLFEGGAVTHPFYEREIIHRNFVFDLTIPPGETKTFYMMAVGGGDLHPPILIWDKNKFVEKTETEFILLGMFYGIIIVMILYNLFLYISLRLRSYLYYVLVITFALLGKLSINGIGFQYIWSNYPTWNFYAAPFFVALSCIFVVIFSRSFLNIDSYITQFKYIAYTLIALNGTVIIALLYSHYVSLYLMVIASFFTFTIVLISAIVSWKRGARQARFYILGWTIFLTGVFINILERGAVIPYSIFTEYAGQTALTFEVVLLSLALADKINIMRKEKDIAEEKAKENQELAIRNLKRADKLKDEFLAVTSHELRTPLYGMIGIAETLRDGIAGPVPEEIKKQLSLIIMSGYRLTHLVNDILDLSKMKSESLTLDYKLVDVRSILEMVVAMSRLSLSKKNIELIHEIQPSLPFIQADENRLQQILHNVIDNAIKYTEEGKVIISAFSENHHVVIQVSDTGIGIHEDDLEKIFEPFQQGEMSASRQFAGVGIGLNIVKRLVELHHGRIEVQSNIGFGSTFKIILPIHQGLLTEKRSSKSPLEHLRYPQMEKNLEPIQPSQFLLKQNKPNAKILVVDDEKVNLQVLMNQLSLNNYDVLTIANGEEVFPIVEKEKIDLIILDIMMPGMSGYEVCQKLRKSYSLMELPILMLTAKNQVQDKILSFEAGANDYLVKPCDKEELLARVKTLIQLKKLNEKLVEMNTKLEEKIKERTLKLKIANENLKEMVEQRKQLLANIAHELGTPLTLIHQYIQSIQKGLIDIHDKHYEKLVIDKINVLNRLIDDIYDLSRLESGKISLDIKEYRVLEWIEQIYHNSKFAVLQNNRKFNFGELPVSLHKSISYIDVERLDQLFSNIITNAIENTAEGSGEITMQLELADNNQLIISVSDNGNGIAEEDLPYIFERFYRKKSTSNESFGTGLGLAIAKQIVESHHGSIWVESKLNEGTTFYITIPIITENEKQTEATSLLEDKIH